MIATEILAVEGQGALFLILAGVGVVVLLIGAFWYGSRRRRGAWRRPGRQSRTPWRSGDRTPGRRRTMTRAGRGRLVLEAHRGAGRGAARGQEPVTTAAPSGCRPRWTVSRH
ncbi:DUF6479 family protein [Streptomyces sp. XY332]|uniref:DUF6479 family protein n=1 Tax=Streptomyces sp. XY332 TaxID=1415561 RepID=UPI000A8A8A63|nr:DUF6479 family protein [Streptomyces sp. XY332]